MDKTITIKIEGEHFNELRQAVEETTSALKRLDEAFTKTFGKKARKPNAQIEISVDKVFLDSEQIVFDGLKSNTSHKVIFKGIKQFIADKANAQNFRP
jgi:hypothetical protein